MNTKHSKKGHLEAAALHHEQAARHHREASRHFEDGRDFVDAAHQAMMAHGHTLHAIDQAHAGSRANFRTDSDGDRFEDTMAGRSKILIYTHLRLL